MSLNILINAYAIAPNWGSELGMGWNWVCNLAKFHNLYIITEGEWKNEITTAIEAAINGDMSPEKNPTRLTSAQAQNMHFYYLPVTERVRRKCWNQGTWSFYFYYRKWEKRALIKAQEIIDGVSTGTNGYNKAPGSGKIDLVHKLNMIGYREPGYLWKINDIPYVWGPVGGYAGIPNAYLKTASLQTYIVENTKNVINWLTFRLHIRMRRCLKRADAVVGAYKETYEALKNIYRPDTVLINETGAFIDDTSKPHLSDKEELNILWVGKYDYRKQLGIAICTMELLKDKKNIHLWVAGTGNPKDIEKYKSMVEGKGLHENVHLMGVVPNVQARQMMKKMDLFLFTSVHDATSTVVPEAISAGLPVICHDMRGYGVLVDNKIGRKIIPQNPETSAKEFAQIIRDLESNRAEISRMSANCIERRKSISWEANAQKMSEVYEKAIASFTN